ncbi:unnamed protein product [Allacma fusca]|uniref:UDP-N-acetylglucosamine transferase subunit ALG14 n=1 Tax=Allacma fusca TaxID=39272 RepID=A0A8J2KHW5_9HEXA|nr:unnamed protein product [Allacma fusca]
MELTVTSLILILGALSVLLKIIDYSTRKKSCGIPAKVMAVLGSGGHTREMIAIMKSLSRDAFSPRIYVYTKNDQLSRVKAEQMEGSATPDVVFKEIHRSREVGQSYVTSVFTTIYSMFGSFLVVYSNRPDVIICTGPGVCVPIVYSAVILKVLGVLDTRIIFVESMCRVKSLSLTGRLVFPVVMEMLD